MTIIHTTYTTIKMPGPKGIIILMSDQRDALVCENTTLNHVRWFNEKEAQELAAKVAKTHGGSTPIRTSVSKPPAADTHRPPVDKNTFMGATSNQPSADQAVDDKKKWDADKEVVVDPDDTNKKLRLGTELDAK
jgi:hypothetical protein